MATYMSTAEDLPRKRDAVRTRSELLAAAQSVFATVGYTGGGVREIAALAGIDASLVRRYFGSKEGLFAAALAEALDIDRMLDTPHESFGQHVVAHFLDGERDSPNPLLIMLLAMTDPTARVIVLSTLDERVVAPLGRWIGGADGALRAARVSMLCSGFFTYWKLLPLDVFANGIDADTRRWLEQSLQSAINGPRP
ncbi:TetR family transcriptional regulator [Sphingomonas sp. CA1-15]|uniref:TetR family transcriptional regulator n=2 Tax=Sphingomonas immobilis TaxID=3063997 RepID=A0ABT8ZW15_9SPHN|nr:TetR family transcriptional regulator [Sphingomonas sp. CA1-15]